jgi:hypothetical protein
MFAMAERCRAGLHDCASTPPNGSAPVSPSSIQITVDEDRIELVSTHLPTGLELSRILVDLRDAGLDYIATEESLTQSGGNTVTVWVDQALASNFKVLSDVGDSASGSQPCLVCAPDLAFAFLHAIVVIRRTLDIDAGGHHDDSSLRREEPSMLCNMLQVRACNLTVGPELPSRHLDCACHAHQGVLPCVAPRLAPLADLLAVQLTARHCLTSLTIFRWAAS